MHKCQSCKIITGNFWMDKSNVDRRIVMNKRLVKYCFLNGLSLICSKTVCLKKHGDRYPLPNSIIRFLNPTDEPRSQSLQTFCLCYWGQTNRRIA